MTTELGLDLDRMIDSAIADVGDALEMRRRAASDAALRKALLPYVPEDGRRPEEQDVRECERRAATLFMLGRDREVGAVAQRADSYRVHHLWGKSELFRDRPVAAAEVLNGCVEKEPRDDRARLQLCGVLALLGRADEARERLGALAEQTDRADVLYCLGAIAETNGDYNEARDHYEKALAHDPDSVDSLFRLAFHHDLSGDDDAAITLYERARRIHPPRVNVLLNLGVLYEDRNEYEKAADCYRQILVQYPNHSRALPFLRDAESSKSMVVDEDMEKKEDRRNQLLRTPISDFELSVRSRNCLAKMSIRSLGDLIQRTEAELLAYKNFGETSLQEIKEILNSKGLRLGMRREEVVVPEGMAGTLTLPDVPGVGGGGGDAVPSDSTPLSELDLSVRSAKCMAMLGLETIGDLLQHSEDELLRAKNFGATSLHEIKQKLTALGLSLK